MRIKIYEAFFQQFTMKGEIKANCAIFFVITLSYRKDTSFYISIIICDFHNPLSYEPILALLLYTDLYVVMFKLITILVGKILGGNCPPPLAPCSYGHGDM